MKHLCDGKIYIINRPVEHLGEACISIIGLQVLTDCDTMSYPVKKGEINTLHHFSTRSLEILVKDVTSKTEHMKLGKKCFSPWYCGKPATK